MSLEVRWTSQADKKFDRIIEYLSREWGEKSTHKFAKRVFEVLDILAEFPEMGSLENKEKFIRGFTIVKQVNVFYKVDEDILIVLDFFDNRRDPDKKRF